MSLSHHVSIDKVLDHPEGKLRLSIRDRSLILDVAQARLLASYLLELANGIEPLPEPTVEVSEAPAE